MTSTPDQFEGVSGNPGPTYGYRVREGRGGPNRPDEMVLYPPEAAIIIEIFGRFVAGETPLAIAQSLNARDIPARSGRPWTDSVIRGRPKSGSGILRNEIYIGRRVRNRFGYLKDPKTGREIARPNPEEMWTFSEMPSLRIVPQELWDQAQAQLRQTSNLAGRTVREQTKWGTRPRGHVLDGILRCATCGSHLLLVRDDEVSCRPTRSGPCAAPVLIKLSYLEQVIADVVKNRFVRNTPREFLNAFRAASKLNSTRRRLMRAALEREHRSVSRHLANLTSAIAVGMQAPEIRSRAEQLSRRKVELAEALVKLETFTAEWEPQAARYREAMNSLMSASATKSVYSMLEKVLVQPVGDLFHLELFGDVARILGLAHYVAANDFASPAESVKLVIGKWFRREIVL